MRCWIDWATGEPSEGVYNFQTLDVLLRLASEQGLKVIVQVYMDSAPAAVISRYGKGKTLMLGSYLGAAYETVCDPTAAQFMQPCWIGQASRGR